MKFGLWLEIENIGLESKIFKRHADWCLAYNESPIWEADRCQLDFSKPEVRALGYRDSRSAGEYVEAIVDQNRLQHRYRR